jgi:hypothetical protein
MLNPIRAGRLLPWPLLALLLAGCAALPNPLGSPAPPDALHPNPRPPAVAPTANYGIRLLFGCACELGGKTVDVTVRQEAVTAASIDGVPYGLDHLVGIPVTVDQLFDYAERNAGAGKDELTYDPVLGYPTALGIDPDTNARDDEIRIAVLELAPGR